MLIIINICFFSVVLEMRQLAERIHMCLSNGADPQELLDIYNSIQDRDSLARMNEIFIEMYNYSAVEEISEKFKVKELYAISSTLKFIRDPNSKNQKARDKFYEEIGYVPRISES